MKKQPKPRKKTRRQYEFNWAQILTRMQDAQMWMKAGHPEIADAKLGEAIRGMKERMYS